jgi:nucleotide-binding universal stress UspA family protein
MLNKILVATDGSEKAENALVYATDLARKYGATLLILSVVPPPVTPLLPAGELQSPVFTREYMEEVKKLYENVVKNAKDSIEKKFPELNVEAILEEGSPAAVICEVAEGEEVDLVVMGSRGIGGITGWIVGSTSRRVVEACTKPVLIIK